MFAPLEKIKVPSIYGGNLPDHMARCTPDMLAAIRNIIRDLSPTKARLVLSDLYRSYDMQMQAHLDHVTGKKPAFSPRPGGSMHEAGRAFDLELKEIKSITLAGFWEVAEAHGVVPIIDTPSSGKSEAWHFDCRGSHALVYEYYAAGKGDNFQVPYRAMAASAIVSTGQRVDDLGDDPLPGYIQSALIRLGQEIGDMDGRVGPKTRAGLQAVGVDPNADLATIGVAIDRLLQEKFPNEYFVEGTGSISTFESGNLIHLAEPLTMIATPAAVGYSPGSKNKAVLGSVSEKLKSATVIDREFVLQPKHLAKLPDGQLYFDSELQLDTDGWPDGKGKGDKYWQAETSLRYSNGRSIDANRVPYMVLPNSAKWIAELGISLGDYAAVIHKGIVTFAVFGDGGPAAKIGEGSIQLLRELGEERIKANGTILDAGTAPGVVTIVFPGSGRAADRQSEETLLKAIRTSGKALFDALIA